MTKPVVAVVGVSGIVGKGVLDALTSPLFKDKYTFPIRALTRDASKYTSTDEIKYYTTGALDNLETLRPALQGVDVLVSALGFHVDRKILFVAAAAEKVKLLFPGGYGIDHTKSQFAKVFTRPEIVEARKHMKVLELFIGFFIRWNLSKPVMGLDRQNNTMIRYGTGDEPKAYTLEEDVGKIIASLAYRPVDQLPDHVKVSGDRITMNGVAKLYESVTGQTLVIEEKSKEDLIAEAHRAMELDPKVMNTDHFNTIGKAASVEDATLDFQNDDSEMINPGLWQWTKFETIARQVWSEKPVNTSTRPSTGEGVTA